MNQEDVCLAVKFQDQCCTALDFLNTGNSLIQKEIDFFEYELYRYLMEPKKWCFMELFNDSQSCSLLERFDGLTSEENPGVLRPDLRKRPSHLQSNNETRKFMSCSQVSGPVLHTS